MELIYFRGLNCHLSSLITLINSQGINYCDAFSTLWSETNFTDETKYNLYISKRVFTNLANLGIVSNYLDYKEPNRKESIDQIQLEELFIVGMDYYFIPWHPVFQNFSGPHYFLAQKKPGNNFLCFDPIYNKENILISIKPLLTAAFELIQICKTSPSISIHGLLQEAKEVIVSHPETISKISSEIKKIKTKKENFNSLIKQINAMINNRYLFERFFSKTEFVSKYQEDFFDKSYFLKWEAIRNGLNKIKVIKDNGHIIDQVLELFFNIMHEELIIAKKIITIMEK